MKFTLTHILLFIVLQVAVGDTYDVLKVAFNNGNSFFCIDQWDNCCNSTEWGLIADIFHNVSASNTRNLRGNEAGVELSNSKTMDGRQLQAYPNICATLCKGYVPGRCLATRCIGYMGRRELLVTDLCKKQLATVKTLFTEIRSSLGARCRALVSAPRELKCHYNITCG